MSSGKLFIVAFYSIGMAATTMAQTTWTNPSLGNWFVSSNWSNGVPGSNGASIANGGTALISSGGAGASNFSLSDGQLLLSGGTLSVSQRLWVSAAPFPSR